MAPTPQYPDHPRPRLTVPHPRKEHASPPNIPTKIPNAHVVCFTLPPCPPTTQATTEPRVSPSAPTYRVGSIIHAVHRHSSTRRSILGGAMLMHAPFLLDTPFLSRRPFSRSLVPSLPLTSHIHLFALTTTPINHSTYLPLPTTTCHHPPPTLPSPTTYPHHLPTPTTTYQHLPPPTTTSIHLPSPTTYLPPPTTTCHHPPPTSPRVSNGQAAKPFLGALMTPAAPIEITGTIHWQRSNLLVATLPTTKTFSLAPASAIDTTARMREGTTYA